ncbi:MAG: cytochrome b5 domain-containing protein [Thioalkalivibrio sp.]
MTWLGRIAYTTLVAFIASLLTLLAVHAMGPEPGAGTEPAESGTQVISHASLAEHNSEQDCWMAIHGRVYDFTEYLLQHPTPIQVLLPYCGTDATTGWDTKGYGRAHSPRAEAMLPAYEIGLLGK